MYRYISLDIYGYIDSYSIILFLFTIISPPRFRIQSYSPNSKYRFFIQPHLKLILSHQIVHGSHKETSAYQITSAYMMLKRMVGMEYVLFVFLNWGPCNLLIFHLDDDDDDVLSYNGISVNSMLYFVIKYQLHRIHKLFIL